MKKQISDEQLDTFMRTLLTEAAADEATIDEIADSPAIWWGVQRQINERKNTTISAWPPVGKVLRWLLVGVPVAAGAALVIAFFVSRPASVTDYYAKSAAQPVNTSVVTEPAASEVASVPVDVETAAKAVQTIPRHEKDQPPATRALRQVKHTPIKMESATAVNKPAANTEKKQAEIKTEFIALSYARDPESGQIVRMRVPSSMMVSLGVVASVTKPTDLVDAEVLVGDDGLTRAIRFIR